MVSGARREGARPQTTQQAAGATAAAPNPNPANPQPGVRPAPAPPQGGVIGDEDELDENDKSTLEQILEEIKKNNDKDKDKQEQGHIEQKTWQEALQELLKNNDLDTFGRTIGHTLFSVTDAATQKLSGGKTDLATLQGKLNTKLEEIPQLPGKCINAIMKWCKGEAGVAEERGVGAERDGDANPADAMRRPDPFAAGGAQPPAAGGAEPPQAPSVDAARRPGGGN